MNAASREAGRAAGSAPPLADPAQVLMWLPTAVVVVDARYVISYANLAAATLGRRIGVRLARGEAVSPTAAEPLRRLVAASLRRGAVREAELELGEATVLADGAVRAGRVVLRLDDVTRRARHLDAAEDFVVNAAHEFLSPLTSIAGAAHALQDGAREQPELRDRFISHITKAADRLIVLSNGLLVLARAEAGAEPPRLEAVRLKPLLADTLMAAGVSSPDSSLRCSASMSALADRDLLSVALATLVHNARRHSIDGSISVTVLDVSGGKVSIEVVNPGYGIPADRAGSLGERFVTLAGRDGGGFGIGLSIAARAVNMLGGTLSLSSNETASNTVTIALIALPSGRLESH